MRIVSLLPAASEIVVGLGCADRLVGRSHLCDYPPRIEELPAVTRPRPADVDPDEEHDHPLRFGLSDAVVDVDALAELAPDLVLTRLPNRRRAESAGALNDVLERRLGAAIVSLQATTLEGILEDVQRVGDALHVPERASALAAALKRRFRAVVDHSRGLPRARVVALQSVDPLKGAGGWLPELVDRAGGRLLVGERGMPAAAIDWERVVDLDPDALVVAVRDASLEAGRAAVAKLAGQPGWGELAAVRSNRVITVNGAEYVNRPGPRIADSLEILAEAIHPDEFEFGHEGRGWERRLP